MERMVERGKPTRCNYSDVYYQTSISTCFGHHYAHHQENKTVYYCMWCSALVVLAVVVVVHTVYTAYGPAPHNHSQHSQCRTPYAVIHRLVLLMMGIMMPETC